LVGKYEAETKRRWQDNIKLDIRKIIFDDKDGFIYFRNGGKWHFLAEK
jgi:hypothetical protein